MRNRSLLTLPAALLVLGIAGMAGIAGCSGMRFVVDAVPAIDEVTETVVIKDGGSDKVALIDVAGLIADRRPAQLLGEGDNMLSRFVESLEKAKTDSRVKAVVLRINSPGGTVGASETMYREVEHFKKTTGKPVVVFMGDVAASGGYYLACAGDEIIALPSTITGSIGVIIQTINVAEGLGRIGIRADAITSGENKAVGSPLQPMRPEHRELLQGIVNEFYASFRNIVLTSRTTLSEADIDWITDGRIVTGRRAAEIGLVDRTGDLRDAFAAAKERAGLRRARLVKYHRPVEFVGSAYAATPAATEVNLLRIDLAGLPWAEQAGFYYLWDPSAWR